MSDRYHATRGNEWRPIRQRGFKIACCDCGLVHRYNFRVRNGRLEKQTFRDERATAQVRRGMRQRRARRQR